MDHAGGSEVVETDNGDVVDVFGPVWCNRDRQVASFKASDLCPIVQIVAIPNGALDKLISLVIEDGVLVEIAWSSCTAIGGEAGFIRGQSVLPFTRTTDGPSNRCRKRLT